MQLVSSTGALRLLRIDPGEEVLGAIERYCAEASISSASLQGIGACKELTLAWYDLDTKEYRDQRYEDFLEIVGMLGNVSLKEGKPFAHVHGTFSDRTMRVIGGHVRQCVVSATCEVTLLPLTGPMARAYDAVMGLWLLCPAA